MKLFYVPNEYKFAASEIRQRSPRDAFEKLHLEGILSEYRVQPFLPQAEFLNEAPAVLQTILREVEKMQPDVIFWQHVGKFPVDKQFLGELRSIAGRALLAYHDDDAFGRVFKRVTPSMRAMLSCADITFVSGTGHLARIMRNNGAKDVRYLPSIYDSYRVGDPSNLLGRRTYKVSMIGNRGTTRIPGVYMPGARNRARLARALTNIHGTNFALYGRGWDGMVSARGAVASEKQGDAIRDSWVSVNWDHFDHISHYFSDRLPISLAAGVPHVTTYHEGFDDMFAGCPGFYAARTVADALSKVDWVLSKPRPQLIDEGRGAHEWVKTRLHADVVFRRAIEACAEKIRETGR